MSLCIVLLTTWRRKENLARGEKIILLNSHEQFTLNSLRVTIPNKGGLTHLVLNEIFPEESLESFKLYNIFAFFRLEILCFSSFRNDVSSCVFLREVPVVRKSRRGFYCGVNACSEFRTVGNKKGLNFDFVLKTHTNF